MIILGENAPLILTLRRDSKPNSNDMKKTFIILTAAALAASIISGKTVRRKLSVFPSSVPGTETLATENMEFVYDYRFCTDTTGDLKENYESDNMLLQIGPGGLSKFSSYRNLAVDSILMRSTREQIIDAIVDGKLSTGEFMTIYKNHPDGKLTHTDKICQDWFPFEEEVPRLDWQLTDSVTTVLGYECRGARCVFRGREWTAFYSEDIPLPDGPWKLHGLPGLIMKASDKKGHYTFECIGIKSNADRPVTIYKVPFNKTDRKGYYDAKHRFDINPYAYYEATSGQSVTVTDASGNPSPGAYDPTELNYDYLETDWKK